MFSGLGRSCASRWLRPRDGLNDPSVLDGAQGWQPCFPGSGGTCGDRHALLTQDSADRLDRMTLGPLLVNEPVDQRRRGSSSPAKKFEAACRISLASFRSRTSHRSRFSSSNSPVVGPSFWPADLGLQHPTAQRFRDNIMLPRQSLARRKHGRVIGQSLKNLTHRTVTNFGRIFFGQTCHATTS